MGAPRTIPVIQFTTVGNGVSTAPPATVSSGDYVNYHGGLIAEVNPTFSTQTRPSSLSRAGAGSAQKLVCMMIKFN
ncbi:MAG: hypothetical protein IPO17_03970 [Flavobacteriales bacterium]|nr:hypothetical protein [Flavobacteriales bacterium]